MECITKDEMTPKEREKALKKGQEVDRLPCTPMITDHAANLINANIFEYLHNAELMAKAHIRAFEIYGHDSIGLNPEVIGLAEAMGAKIQYFKYGRGQIKEPLIQSHDDMKKLRVIDPKKDGRLFLYFKALRMIHTKIGDQVRVSTGIGGPFTTAGLIRGTNNFLVDLIRDHAFVHKIMEITTKNVMHYMETAFEYGFSCSMGEPLASCSVISPKQFKKFVKPYIEEISNFCVKHRGKGPSIHICGKSQLIWNELIDAGISRISLDEIVDLEEAKKNIGDRVALSGNVSPVKVLLQGNREQVLDATKECIKKAIDTPKGFTLSSGCTVATNTPIENIKAFIEGARIYKP